MSKTDRTYDNPTIKIIPMQSQHLDDVVRVHLASFPNFFLTFLGSRFLRLLYEEITATPTNVALVAVDNNEIIGFVAGVTHQSGFYRLLVRRRLLAFALASLTAVLRRPSIVPRLLRALTYSRTTQKAAAQALLMSIAVAPQAARTGIGQQLIKVFLTEMKARDVNTVTLTTDQYNNERTNHFYQKLGFKLSNSYITPEGRGLNEYLIKLNEVDLEKSG